MENIYVLGFITRLIILQYLIFTQIHLQKQINDFHSAGTLSGYIPVNPFNKV